MGGGDAVESTQIAELMAPLPGACWLGRGGGGRQRGTHEPRAALSHEFLRAGLQELRSLRNEVLVGGRREVIGT